MKVQDVMNKYPVTVAKDAPIADVAKLLVRHNISAVSVVDPENTLLGIITEGDLLYKKIRPHVPHYVGEYNEQFTKLLASSVAELMTEEVITAKADEDVEEVVAVMLDKHLKTVPVVDGKNHLIGEIARRDVIELIAKEND